jgi:hypothetical protein
VSGLIGARLLPWDRRKRQEYPAPDHVVERMNTALRRIARREGITRTTRTQPKRNP